MMYGAPPVWALLALLIAVLMVAGVYLAHVVAVVWLFRQVPEWRANSPRGIHRGWIAIAVSATVAGLLDARLPLGWQRRLAEFQAVDDKIQATQLRWLMAAQQGDAAALRSASDDVIRLSNQISIDDFYRPFVTHADQRVQLEAMRMLRKHADDSKSFFYPNEALSVWEAVIRDPSADPVLRRETVQTWAMVDGSDRARLFVVLQEVDDAPELAVGPLTEVIAHDVRPYFDAPIDVVNYLASLGSAASTALPALEQALRHENEWDYVPAVVHAVGAIGGKAAIPTLHKAAQSQRPEIREAAQQELARLEVNPN